VFYPGFADARALTTVKTIQTGALSQFTRRRCANYPKHELEGPLRTAATSSRSPETCAEMEARSRTLRVRQHPFAAPWRNMPDNKVRIRRPVRREVIPHLRPPVARLEKTRHCFWINSVSEACDEGGGGMRLIVGRATAVGISHGLKWPIMLHRQTRMEWGGGLPP